MCKILQFQEVIPINEQGRYQIGHHCILPLDPALKAFKASGGTQEGVINLGATEAGAIRNELKDSGEAYQDFLSRTYGAKIKVGAPGDLLTAIVFTPCG